MFPVVVLSRLAVCLAFSPGVLLHVRQFLFIIFVIILLHSLIDSFVCPGLLVRISLKFCLNSSFSRLWRVKNIIVPGTCNKNYIWKGNSPERKASTTWISRVSSTRLLPLTDHHTLPDSLACHRFGSLLCDVFLYKVQIYLYSVLSTFYLCFDPLTHTHKKVGSSAPDRWKLQP